MGSCRYFAVKAWERPTRGKEETVQGKDGKEGCRVKEMNGVEKKEG
jgi:hypothetical protein